MAEGIYRNYRAIAQDISEGFVTANPLYLKRFDEDALKTLLAAIERMQREARTEPCQYNNPVAIRKRNVRLQRLYAASIVIKNYARERGGSQYT